MQTKRRSHAIKFPGAENIRPIPEPHLYGSTSQKQIGNPLQSHTGPETKEGRYTDALSSLCQKPKPLIQHKPRNGKDFNSDLPLSLY
jgi:hypothetical protein